MNVLGAIWDLFKGLFGQFYGRFLACLCSILWHV